MFCRSLVPYKKVLPKLGQGGFGLVELMVSISIMVIVSAIILVQHNSFNSAVLLRNQAYEVAFDLREVQLGAVSASGAEGGVFRSVYGVYFDSTTGNDGVYKIFRDGTGGGTQNGFYDDATELFGTAMKLDPRFEISEIRVVGSLSPVVNELSVIFVRPNFDARFFTGPADEKTENSVEIDISPRGGGAVRTVEITSTGQIGVQ